MPPAAKEDSEISAEMSKRVCTHMNDDHAVSVYAMARSLLGDGVGKITDAKLKEVTMTGCDIAVVTCKGDMCEMKRVSYPFQPPLASASEVRSRMVEIHKDVCAPSVSWLFTHVDAFAVLLVCGLIGYWVNIMGIETLTEKIDDSSQLNVIISSIFGSAATFGKAVKGAWIFLLVAHTAEAVYVVYHAKMTLKVGVKGQFLWYALVSIVGYPITKEFLSMMKLQAAQKQKA